MSDRKMAESAIFESVKKFEHAKREAVIPDLSTLVEEIIHDARMDS